MFSYAKTYLFEAALRVWVRFGSALYETGGAERRCQYLSIQDHRSNLLLVT